MAHGARAGDPDELDLVAAAGGVGAEADDLVGMAVAFEGGSDFNVAQGSFALGGWVVGSPRAAHRSLPLASSFYGFSQGGG
jgi:hypothetical protein